MTQIRALTPDDRPAALALDQFAFVADPTKVPPEIAMGALDPARTFVVDHPDGAQLAGLYSSFDLRLRVPGARAEGPGATRAVPVDGLTWVAVHPDMRRQGVLRRMIRHHLEAAHDAGEAIAGLHASEPGIYGRFGYAVASHDVSYSLGRGETFDVPAEVAARADVTTVTTVLDLDSEGWARRLREIDVAAPTLGTVVVPGAAVRRRLRDVPGSRIGTEPLRALVATRDGRDVGAAVFTRRVEWTDGNPDGTVSVRHLAAADPAAMLALGRRLVDMDLTGTVEFAERGLDDLLLTWAGSVRRRSVRIADGLWLRPVDVARMLATRGYAAPADLTLDVVDATCEWNTGRWRLVVAEDGTAECARTSQDADLRLDVGVLGEIYLGLRGAAALAAQGRIAEVTPGAVTSLTSAFATGVTPIGGSSF